MRLPIIAIIVRRVSNSIIIIISNRSTSQSIAKTA
jgi:hypothetical protein